MGRKVGEDNEDGEDLKELGGSMYKGGSMLMEAGAEEGSIGVRVDWPDISKTNAKRQLRQGIFIS
jgi:hypothetical protein